MKSLNEWISAKEIDERLARQMTIDTFLEERLDLGDGAPLVVWEAIERLAKRWRRKYAISVMIEILTKMEKRLGESDVRVNLNDCERRALEPIVWAYYDEADVLQIK